MLKQFIEIIDTGTSLTSEQAEQALSIIMDGNADNNQIEHLLLSLSNKGEHITELVGFAKAMRAHSISVNLDNSNLLDTCGTGGDGGNIFNISTAVAFVAAAAGIPVAKHGNRAVSGKSGSVDVLEALGINIQLDQLQSQHIFNETNLVFLFAQQHHPTMKYVAPIRKKLQRRTIFNMVGPLTNPAGASYQIIGVYSESLAEQLGEALLELGGKQALIVHSHSGLDELSIDGANTIVEIRNGELRKYTITPEEVGLQKGPLCEVSGGSAKENAETIVDVFRGTNKGVDRDMLVFNAGAALYIADKCKSIAEGVQLVEMLLDSKQVYKKYQQYKQLSNQFIGTEGAIS
ncbi:anthranilate phosphoribosyltransferase [Desulfuribacillus alkaliarsenatis]|uniref:Anthranilate phosphoribosyltransferase n=1 Tax=Desulfuribacillus alkaliarsenatis TaxID=766136 RepID=A0A1E5G6B6_9FIRM|nr:anthranilate phosphoribosyltransferase [Desulfuribacillus alkaliarsenatis]OEF98716.1 anthranilate phosphoribosyltransferase [Desulfuribacillus alkaliarsenatis]